MYVTLEVSLQDSPDIALVEVTDQKTGKKMEVLHKSTHMPSQDEIDCETRQMELAALKNFSEMLGLSPFSPKTFILKAKPAPKPDKESTTNKVMDGISKIMKDFGSWANFFKNLPALNSTSSTIQGWINNRGFDHFLEDSQFTRDIGIKQQYISK